MKTIKYYYALFIQTSEAVEVSFPDLSGCVTFATTWEEALENAKDVLAAWLAHAERQFIQAPSTHEMLKNFKRKGELVPILIDEKIISSYQELKRFNVILPVHVLDKIDRYRRKLGLKRSTFLQKAAEAYLERRQ